MAAARDNVAYVEAFKAQLSNPNTMTDEQKVLKEFSPTQEAQAVRDSFSRIDSKKREFIAGQIHKASCVGSGHLRSPNNTEQWE